VFSLIWRFLPGPAWVRIVIMLMVLAAIAYALMFWGYPWVAQLLETGDISTVGE